MSEEHLPTAINEAQAIRISAIVDQWFAARSIRIVQQGGVLVFPDHPERGQMGLWNLTARCAAVPEEHWQAFIEEHLQQLDDFWVEQARVAEQIKDFDFVRERITTQIWPEAQAAAAPDPVGRVDLEGTRSLLMLDLPTAIKTLRRVDTDVWGRSDDELFDLAITNLDRMLSPVRQDIDIGQPDQIAMITAQAPLDCYGATLSLMMHRFDDLIGVHGTLVSVCNRDMLMGFPINAAECVRALSQMVMIAHKAVADRPYGISSDIYWRKPDGTFVTIPCPEVDGQVQMRIPDEFMELLNTLAESNSV